MMVDVPNPVIVPGRYRPQVSATVLFLDVPTSIQDGIPTIAFRFDKTEAGVTLANPAC
jgi:hypothetical protein